MSEETVQELVVRLAGVVSYYARRNEHGGNLAMRVIEGLAHEEDQRREQPKPGGDNAERS